MVTQAGNPDPPPPPRLFFHTDSIIHVKWGVANPCGSPVDGYELQKREIRASDAVGAGEAAAWRLAPWETIGVNFVECEYVLSVETMFLPCVFLAFSALWRLPHASRLRGCHATRGSVLS